MVNESAGRRAVVGGLLLALGGAVALAGFWPASARGASQPVVCGGAAMLGAAQLMCSHVDPKAAAQLCTFSWALVTDENVSRVVEGSFLMPPKAANVQVYQGGGFSAQLTPPIIICHPASGHS